MGYYFSFLVNYNIEKGCIMIGNELGKWNESVVLFIVVCFRWLVYVKLLNVY